MLNDTDFLHAVYGKTECDIKLAAHLLEKIVRIHRKGQAGILDYYLEAAVATHGISSEDLAFLKATAESLVTGSNGAPPLNPVTISAADLYAKDIAPPKWIIENVLPAGLTILAGNPKAGKSWLALDLAIAAASGGSLFGSLDCEYAHDVLYLALEDTDYRLKDRMKRLLVGSQPPAQLSFSTAWPRADQDGLNHLSSWVESNKNAGLIIIDTLQMIRPTTAKNGNIYAEDYKAVRLLKQIADEYKIAIVLVHHLRKAKSSDPFEKISGSYGLTGAADTNCVLERDPSTSNASLHIRGRDVGDTSFALMFDKDMGRWQLLGEHELPATQMQQSILATVKAKAKKPSEIAEILGTSAGSISVTLGKMVKKGIVIKAGYGKYISAMHELEKQL